MGENTGRRDHQRRGGAQLKSGRVDARHPVIPAATAFQAHAETSRLGTLARLN